MRTLIINLLLIFSVLLSIAQETQKNSNLSIKIGGFFPSDPQIKGLHIINFETNGSQAGVYISGFGNGIATSVEAMHYFSNWGLRLESGLRIHNSHNINLNHTSGNDTYDNRLLIVPVTFGPVYYFLTYSKIAVFISPSVGYYYGDMKQMHESTDLSNVVTIEEINGNKSSIGLNMMAGIEVPIYYDLLLGIDMSYSIIQSKWKLNNVTNDTSTENSLDIGGVGINLSLKYRF